MIKSITVALAMISNNNRVKTGTHVVMKPDIESNGPPGIVDKQYNFGKHQWMQSKLDQMQSDRTGILEKEKIANNVLESIDPDGANLGPNLVAGGLLEDWDFAIDLNTER